MTQQKSLFARAQYQLKAYALAFKQAPLAVSLMQLPFLFIGGMTLLLTASAVAAAAIPAAIIFGTMTIGSFMIGHYLSQAIMARDNDTLSPFNQHLRQSPMVQKTLARKIDMLPEYQRPLAWQNIQHTVSEAQYDRAFARALQIKTIMTMTAAATVLATTGIVAALPFIMLSAPLAWMASKQNKASQQRLQNAQANVQAMLDIEKQRQEKIRQAELEQLAAKVAATAAPAVAVTLPAKPRVRTIGDSIRSDGIKLPPATPQ